ncbi:hypothetical protein C6H66_09805 [Photorhabdus hindustanensis]|uniref:Antitoxin n=2 Tax=Photorhabdus hindustanensis TaxID=2918802 RepID=A0A2S8Q387_9GAMM|nr:hypothetical protein C6H66_09805 [Photorhabdus hindustanensis]
MESKKINYDKVNDDHKPILITHQNGKPAITLSLEDFQTYEETAYLMRVLWKNPQIGKLCECYELSGHLNVFKTR